MLDFVVVFVHFLCFVCNGLSFGLSMFCKCSLLPFAHEVSLNLWMAVCCMAVAAVVFCFF